MKSSIFTAILLTASMLVGCGAGSENWQARSAVDEESQGSGSASLDAYPPSAPGDDGVAIGVDQSKYEDTDPSAITEFRGTLEPYGTWEDTPTYGTVWIPATAVVGPDFVPYSTAGHWAYDAHSPHGNWVWVSDYSWGWAPFHYGRWVLIPGRGWAWVPGRVYASAWVTWSYGPTYVGWAPLGPTFYWYHGYAVAHPWYYDPYYVYCPHTHIFHPHVHTHVVHGPAAAPIAASTPPYVPARPTVDTPGRIPASPTVDSGRTPASPTVGPAPAQLGYNDTAVVRPSGKGLEKAQALSNPKEAKAFGAKPPGAVVPAALPPDIPRYNAPAAWGDTPSDGARLTGSTRRAMGGAATPTTTATSAPRETSADAWRVDDARARAPRDPWAVQPRATERASAPMTPSASGFNDRFRSSGQPAAASGFGSRSIGSQTMPTSRSPEVFAPPSRPVSPSGARPSTAPSAPVYRSPSVSSSPSPTFRSPPSSPAPTFRSSAPSSPSPSFRSAPSAPAMRSAPAAAPAKPSTPAPSRPSSAPVRSIRR